jgi:hypothetical protein
MMLAVRDTFFDVMDVLIKSQLSEYRFLYHHQ